MDNGIWIEIKTVTYGTSYVVTYGTRCCTPIFQRIFEIHASDLVCDPEVLLRDRLDNYK